MRFLKTEEKIHGMMKESSNTKTKEAAEIIAAG